ncbi:TPA: hypothetical protein DEX28_00210 [Patescibacteria group bacterium]|uniref:Uncharacterized protein n=1 Tax=Candidatus Woesebacteria bacterium GW2011_GWB1_44_11b TaxID=1618580 RepID=A0A0G1IQF8_9BACT|nr:MAG: hypothetical protein UW21_C0005G0011 [Candidatus Woesebacteria bacterium GW2011_GWB1_44_11b]HCI05155.1 hypothetical protein [Patescibacteria group bacterium]
MENRNKKGKDLLLELEKTGQYLFHGSENEIEIFEPHQAYNFINGKKTKDDKPGVHASPFAEVAVFMSLINNKNCPAGFSNTFYWNGSKVVLGATKQALDQLNNAKGYVYVFDKFSFKQRSSIEYIHHTSIKPLRMIEVGFKDLPENVELIEDFRPSS